HDIKLLRAPPAAGLPTVITCASGYLQRRGRSDREFLMISWRQGWHEFDLPDKEGYFLRELQWEIQENPGHPLHGKESRIIGWRRGYDDFILYLPAEARYAY